MLYPASLEFFELAQKHLHILDALSNLDLGHECIVEVCVKAFRSCQQLPQFVRISGLRFQKVHYPAIVPMGAVPPSPLPRYGLKPVRNRSPRFFRRLEQVTAIELLTGLLDEPSADAQMDCGRCHANSFRAPVVRAPCLHHPHLAQTHQLRALQAKQVAVDLRVVLAEQGRA